LGSGPAVLLNALPKPAAPLPAVVPDEVEAGRAAARLLLEAGHRDGIYLIGAGPSLRDVPPWSVAATERLVGIREVLRASGVKVAGGIQCEEWLPDDGFAAMRQLLGTTRPRAVICLNDRLAMGVYQALDDAGLKVPTEVSVV